MRITCKRYIASMFAAAASLAVVGARPAMAQSSPDITEMSPSSGQFQLTDTSYASATENLYSNVLTHHVDLTHVITTDFTRNSAGADDSWLNLRSMRACSGASEVGALPPVTTSIAWCWSSSHADDTTAHWYPQGLSTTGTADGSDGAISGDRVVAVSWHYALESGETSSGCKTQNVIKLTFIDRDTRKYRHVLLVEPTSTSSGASNFGFVTGHGGGIVWYSHYIYVTDTAHGIRVFTTGWRRSTTTAPRSRPSACTTAGRAPAATRTSCRRSTAISSRVRRRAATAPPSTRTDGNGLLNFDLHKGCGTSDGVFSHTWIGDTRSTTTCASRGNWAAGTPQALSYWPVLGTTQVDELWGLTEQPGQRTVFAVGFTDPTVQALH